MRKRNIFLIALIISSPAFAAKVTAVSGISGGNTGAFVGYQTGEVYFCPAVGGCTKLSGTPTSPVTDIGTSANSSSKGVAFVGYENGNIYSCTFQNCSKIK